MIRRAGWRTATARDSGNVSSLWRYKTGARRRARTAPLSVGLRAPGRFAGRRGMCACGPHAVSKVSVNPTQIHSRISVARVLNEWPSKFTYATPAAQRRVRSNWRAHAQATSERVQSRSGPFPHQQRPQRISAQLSLLLRIDRTRPARGASPTVRPRHPAVQKLRQDCALRSRRGLN